MYKTFDNQRHELVAYELMSANDAPERDPKDWYDVFSILEFLLLVNKCVIFTQSVLLAYYATFRTIYL